MKIKTFLIFFVFASLLFSKPKWANDTSNNKYWIGIGQYEANSYSNEDPQEIAFLRAVKSIASEMSIEIISNSKFNDSETISMDSNGETSITAKSSWENALVSKVETSLSDIKISKKTTDGDIYYCKVQLDKKKYYKKLANRRDESISSAKEILAKVSKSNFDGSILTYLDDALTSIIEFQYGIDNEFVTLKPPMLIIKDCPDSGTEITIGGSTIKSNDSNNQQDEVKDQILKNKNGNSESPYSDKFKKIKDNSDRLLEQMRRRIEGYGTKSKPQANNKISISEISKDEDVCRKCLEKSTCTNPFSEECECAEDCGMVMQNELCQEKEILLIEHIYFLLDEYTKRINISGPENILNIKFGTNHDRIIFRTTDSYLDKMAFKSFDDLIEERSRVIYKSPEWARIQNLINQLLDSNKRHEEGIVSLPLFNMPLSISIGNEYTYSTVSDKGGYFNVDFPKFIEGSNPFLYISLDSDAFATYKPMFSSFLKIPINIDPLLIYVEVDEINEWNDNLGEPLDSYIIEQFTNSNFNFTDDKLSADRYILVDSENIITSIGNDMYKSKHLISLSYSDKNGVLYEKSIKNKKTISGFGTTNDELKNLASKSKSKISKRFKKELKKIYNTIIDK